MMKLLMVAFLMAASGAFFMLLFAKKMKFVDMPTSRSSHAMPTPRAGGVGIWFVFLWVSIVVLKEYGLAILGGLLGLFSLGSDRFSILPKIRLFFHLIVSFVIVFLFFGPPAGLHGCLLYVFFTLFIAGTANYYNFMDGIDGIAAIVGMVSFGLIAYYTFFLSMDSRMGILALAIVFACFGFLPFNFPRAKIFMGDIGSILLGFLFAYFVVRLSMTFLDFLCLASFLSVFYADELVTMCVRLKDGENLTHAHRRHFYQILVNQFKIAHWKVSILYGFFQFLIGSSILALRPFGAILIFSVLTIYFVCFILLNVWVRIYMMPRIKNES